MHIETLVPMPGEVHPFFTQLYHHCCIYPFINTMRAFPRLRMASPSSVGTQSSGLRPPPMALLPPIPLYRRLLRAHRRHLPKEMRLLGDEYIKSEFRAHRNVDNPVHIVRAAPIRDFKRQY